MPKMGTRRQQQQQPIFHSFTVFKNDWISIIWQTLEFSQYFWLFSNTVSLSILSSFLYYSENETRTYKHSHTHMYVRMCMFIVQAKNDKLVVKKRAAAIPLLYYIA